MYVSTEFKFRKLIVPTELAKPTVKKPEPLPLVVPPINFRDLIYASINENGVIFLFSSVAEDLGITQRAFRLSSQMPLGNSMRRIGDTNHHRV